MLFNSYYCTVKNIILCHAYVYQFEKEYVINLDCAQLLFVICCESD